MKNCDEIVICMLALKHKALIMIKMLCANKIKMKLLRYKIACNNLFYFNSLYVIVNKMLNNDNKKAYVR